MVQAMIRLSTWLNEIDIQEFVQAEQKAMSIDILHETFANNPSNKQIPANGLPNSYKWKLWCIHRELESKHVARIFWRGWTKRELLTILSITIGGGPSTNPTVSGGIVARPADVGGTFRQRPGYKHGWCVCGDERCVVSRRGDISRSGWAGTRGLYEKIKTQTHAQKHAAVA